MNFKVLSKIVRMIERLLPGGGLESLDDGAAIESPIDVPEEIVREWVPIRWE